MVIDFFEVGISLAMMLNESLAARCRARPVAQNSSEYFY